MDFKKKPSITFGRETFIIKNEGQFADFYEIVKEIGSGSYGHVYRVKSKTSKEYFACKQLVKGKIDNMEAFNIEIGIMGKMDHPNIIKLYEIFEDVRYLYLVMEECVGGELFDQILDRINNKHMFTEKEAANIFKQMMSAICYCHSQKICHRDLKPENLLFLSKEKDSPIKIIDFGLSKIYVPKKKGRNSMKTKVGTAYYVSPEVLQGDYDEKCDIWSAGVILYIILSGEPPFNGENDMEIYRNIEKKKFSFPEKEWKNISQEVKDLIKFMICDPDKRYTAEQVLNHPWVVNSFSHSTANLTNFNVESLKLYKKAHKLKKAVLTFIASRLKENEVKNLKEIFQLLDKNKDGTITLEEMKEGMSILKDKGVDINVEEIFQSIDTDKSGGINYTEFIAASIDQKIYLKEERLYEAFRMFDKDNSGKISKDEIKKVLNLNKDNDQSIDDFMKELDLNGDGEIDYNEFITMMTNKS